MSLAGIIDSSRTLLRDSFAPYRWGDNIIVGYINDAVKEIRQLRPDTRLTSTSGEVPFVEIAPLAPFTYTADPATYVAGFGRIQGWSKGLFPNLFLKCASGVVSIYGSEDDMDLSTDALATFTGTAGLQTLTEGLFRGQVSGFGGSINVLLDVPNATEIEVAAQSSNMIVDDVFDDAIVAYVCSQCLACDAEDTLNMKRSSDLREEFLTLVVGG